MTHPHIWPRAAHKIAPNGARFSRYVVLLVRQHGTVKTVPYKQTDRLNESHTAENDSLTVRHALPDSGASCCILKL